MKKILISDTHFGVKNNSTTWFNHQKDFIYKQLIPHISTLKEDVVLYHLGDVFDSRSSINPYIASQVRQIFVDLSHVCDEIFVIGGNHDYYSPNEDENNVNSLDLILSDIEGVCLLTKGFYVEKPDLFIPWFRYEDVDEIEKIIKDYDIKNVFCHADLPHMDFNHQRMFKNVNVYSGHIHTPEVKGNLHTLGSTYPLTFADCNAERGFYVLEDDKLTFYPNKYCINFYRFKNEEIFDALDKVKSDDYIELYIDQNLLFNDDYTEKIKEISKIVHNTNIVPVNQQSVNEDIESFEDYNIESICKESIPEELKVKFEKVIEKSQEIV